MTKSFIKSFSVYGLFGKDDVNIPFNESIKILIGENGIGKTQILNIFYYTLTRNFSKLRALPFDNIKILFNNDLIFIERQEIIDCFRKQKKALQSQLIDNDTILGNDIGLSNYHYNIIEYDQYGNVNRKKRRRTKEFKLSSHLLDCSKILEKNLEEKNILYFPTFRRVEEDLHNLGYDEEELSLNEKDSRLIHFGMDDVQKRFNIIEKKNRSFT